MAAGRAVGKTQAPIPIGCQSRGRCARSPWATRKPAVYSQLYSSDEAVDNASSRKLRPWRAIHRQQNGKVTARQSPAWISD